MCYNLVTVFKNRNKSSKETAMANQNNTLAYKGHPLRRKDSLIYYGSMAQK